MEMKNTGPNLSKDDLKQFEKRIDFLLPGSYREFLLQFNGGRPNPYHFFVPNWRHQRSLVNDFNGIVPGKYNDLEEDIGVLEDRLPKGFIPIADDPGGNRILLGLHGPTQGKIYFWDHENEPEDPTDNLEDYSNIYLLADNFADFLKSLRYKDGSPEKRLFSPQRHRGHGEDGENLIFGLRKW